MNMNIHSTAYRQVRHQIVTILILKVVRDIATQEL